MSDSVQIHILHCGQVCVDPALPFKENTKNPIAFTGIGRNPKNRLWLPVSAYLIEHPKGLILLDTGWHKDVRKNQIKHMTLKHYILNQARLPEGEAIDEQLAKMNIKISDIDYVILSHLHTDHASGLKLVKDAKKILVSDLEVQDTNKYPIRYAKSMWEGVPLTTFSFKDTSFGPVGRSYDLFDDGSVILVNTPGHTNGLVTTLIRKEDRYVVMFSDTGYAEKSWKQMISPGTALDKEQARKSLEWIKEMSSQKECIESLANHDVDIKPHVIIL
jgi:glyoxylase-like metal-dependent hydrolase (beta-lactamase superfamily II)